MDTALYGQMVLLYDCLATMLKALGPVSFTNVEDRMRDFLGEDVAGFQVDGQVQVKFRGEDIAIWPTAAQDGENYNEEGFSILFCDPHLLDIIAPEEWDVWIQIPKEGEVTIFLRPPDELLSRGVKTKIWQKGSEAEQTLAHLISQFDR